MCSPFCPYCRGTGIVTEEHYNDKRESMEQFESKCPRLVEGTDEYNEVNNSDCEQAFDYLSETLGVVAAGINEAIK